MLSHYHKRWEDFKAWLAYVLNSIGVIIEGRRLEAMNIVKSIQLCKRHEFAF
jgi:hypothetical protein